MARKGKKDGSLGIGEAGSYEWHNRHLYGSAESPSPKAMANIINPDLVFRTDKEPMWTFRGMLRILVKRKFSFAVEYDGPELGLSDSTRELVPMNAVLEALQEHADTEPPFTGFRMVLVHDADEKVMAYLKVKNGVKVKLKIKGTLTTIVWDKIRVEVRKKFHVDV
jgi:hypothetical protein